jgi:hypothetical protein
MVISRSSLLALALVVTACASNTPRTEVIVVVDTDLRGPSGIDSLFIEVTSPSGDRQTSMARLGDGEAPLPRSIGLLWETGPLGPFTVRVAGNSGGTERVTRTARFTFQRSQTLILPMNLLARCERTTCMSAETCGESGCRSVDIAPAELLPYAGVIPGLDGAAPSIDGGVDASMPIDGGPGIDAGRDAGGAIDASPAVDVGTDAFVPTDSCPGNTETCNALDDDCDGMTDEGFVLDTDPMNCGACGHACDFANAAGSCIAGVCTISACDTGWDDCNATGDDGCEIDLTADPDHCGTCAMACTSPDRVCCASTCARRCP